MIPITGDTQHAKASGMYARWVALKGWITKHLVTDSEDWTEERLILFTEYRDTLDYLRARHDPRPV